MSFALYVHIPFCKKKCNYCDFPSYAGKESFIPDYLEALRAEAGYISTLHDRPKISSLYIGGGTPTLLTEEQISILFDSIASEFNIESTAEITVEANPGTVTEGKLKVLKRAGANRISLGAQTYNNKLLRKLGRIHKEHDITEAYGKIREAGFRNVNLDLIFAIPGESMDDWQETLRRAVELKPEHISTYNLQVEEDTPFHLEAIEGCLKLPDEEKELKMYKTAILYLAVNGYSQYEISNHSRKGFECRHNRTYWSMQEYIGIGLGAHSYIDGTRTGNSIHIDKYLSKNMKIIKQDHKNTKKENMQEFIFLGLRLLEGFDLNDFTARFGIAFRERYKKELNELTSDGLLELSGKSIRLTKKGLFIANEVFKAFL